VSSSNDRCSERTTPAAERLINHGIMPPQTLEFLEACLLAKLNLAISGPQGSSKRRLLYSLASLLPADEQILAIQNPDEPSLAGKGITALRANLAPDDGKHIITRQYLLSLAPKMHPQRLLLDCVQGSEALPLLKLLFVMGGVMFSIVADSPKDALFNLERMLLSEAGSDMRMMRRILSGSLDLIIQLQRLQEGTARIVSLSEVSEVEDDVIVLRDIFVRQEMEAEEDEAVRSLHATGIRPQFTERLQTLGIFLPADTFVSPHKKKGAAA
jgi:pilus assembly protein CpaF